MNLSEHFTLEEMIASQTAARYGIDNTPNDDQIQCLANLCTNILEPVRSFLKQSNPSTLILISSGFRCPELNKKIGGSTTSQHCFGEAADFTAKNWSVYDAFRAIALGGFPYDQIIYEGTWVHASFTVRKPNRGQILKAFFGNGPTKYQLYSKDDVANGVLTPY